MEYYKKLIEQFKNATGVKNVNINSKQFCKEFSEWIRNRQLIGKGYVSMLDYMEINPAIDSDTAEVGKGVYDSITKNSNFAVITPYSYGLKNLTNGVVVQSSFRVSDGIPIFAKNNKCLSNIRRFITQNPYNQSCISNWEELHNSGVSNIIVGIYGSINDKDVPEKIKQLKMLKAKLCDDSINEEYATVNDEYYYALGSNRKVLVKTLTR